MKTFKVHIEEILSRVVKQEADTEETATRIVTEKYHSGKIVLNWEDSVAFKIEPEPEDVVLEEQLDMFEKPE